MASGATICVSTCRSLSANASPSCKPIEEWAEQAESRIVAKLSPQGERDTLLLMTTLLRLNEWKLMAARSSHREQQRR
jgi:hypothetical protein